MDNEPSKVNASDEWWRLFMSVWNRNISAYFDKEVVARLDQNERFKLQQRLEQLIVCMEENFHAQFDSRFVSSQDQVEQQERIQQKEDKLKTLVSEVQNLRASVRPSIQESYDTHYNKSRDALDQIDTKATQDSICSSFPSIPTIETLQEQQQDVSNLSAGIIIESPLRNSWF